MLTFHLPADDRQIWDLEQGEYDLPVCYHLLHLGLWHHHTLPILPGFLAISQIEISHRHCLDREPGEGV